MHVGRDADARTEVCLEHGPHLWPSDIDPCEHKATPASGLASHDPHLDVVAATFESAIVMLAARVRARYGDDRANI